MPPISIVFDAPCQQGHGEWEWGSLPAHIIRVVLASLDLPTLAMCARVSKHWQSSFANELFWQSRLERSGCITHSKLSTESHADARERFRRAITCHRSWTTGRPLSRVELAAPGIGQISAVDFDEDGVTPRLLPLCPRLLVQLPSARGVWPLLGRTYPVAALPAIHATPHAVGWLRTPILRATHPLQRVRAPCAFGGAVTHADD
jgi:hypothetical protein